MSARVELEIDELIVDGLDARERDALVDALARELERLLAERGLPGVAGARGAAVSVAVAPVDVEGDVGGDELGAKAAAAIYGALDR